MKQTKTRCIELLTDKNASPYLLLVFHPQHRLLILLYYIVRDKQSTSCCNMNADRQKFWQGITMVPLWSGVVVTFGTAIHPARMEVEDEVFVAVVQKFPIAQRNIWRISGRSYVCQDMCAWLVVCGRIQEEEEDVEDRKYYIVFNFRFCSQFQTRYKGIILRLRFYGPTQREDLSSPPA